MPRVPDYRVPTVGAQPAPGATFNAPQVEPVRDFRPQQLQQLGRAAESAFSVAANKFDEAQLGYDEAKIKDAELRIADNDRAVLQELQTKIGEEAVDGAKPALDRMQTFRDQVLKGLDNERQRDLVGRAAEARMIDRRSQIGAYQNKQLRAFNISRSSARVIELRQMAREAYGQAPPEGIEQGVPGAPGGLGALPTADGLQPTGPSPFERYKKAHDDEARRLAELQSASPEEAKLQLQAARTQFHGEVIDMLVGVSAQQAKDYLDDNRKEMDSVVADKFDAELAKATLAERAGRSAIVLESDLMATRVPPPTDPEQGVPQPPGRGAFLASIHRATFLVDARNQLDQQVAAGMPIAEANEIYKQLESRHKAREAAVAAQGKQDIAEAESILIANQTLSPSDLQRLRPQLYRRLEMSGNLGTIVAFAQSKGRRPIDPAMVALIHSDGFEGWARSTFDSRDALEVALWGSVGQDDRKLALSIWDGDNQFFDLSIKELQTSFAREFGVIPKDDPDAFMLLRKHLQGIAQEAGLKRGVLPKDYEEQVINVARERRAFTDLTSAQEDIEGLSERGIPLALHSPEQRAVASVLVEGKSVKLADITEDARAYLTDLARQSTDPDARIGPTETLRGAKLAKWWMGEGRLRPYSGIPDNELGQRERIAKGMVLKSEPEMNRLVNKSIPSDVITQLQFELETSGVAHNRAGRRVFRERDRLLSAGQIWDLWVDLGKPMSATAARRKRGGR